MLKVSRPLFSRPSRYMRTDLRTFVRIRLVLLLNKSLSTSVKEYKSLLLLLVTNGKTSFMTTRSLGWQLGKKTSTETSSELATFSASSRRYKKHEIDPNLPSLGTSSWLLDLRSRVKVISRSSRKLALSKLTSIVSVPITPPTSNRKKWRLVNVLPPSTWSIVSLFVLVTKREKTKPIPLDVVHFDSNTLLSLLRTRLHSISSVKIRFDTSTR